MAAQYDEHTKNHQSDYTQIRKSVDLLENVVFEFNVLFQLVAVWYR